LLILLVNRQGTVFFAIGEKRRWRIVSVA